MERYRVINEDIQALEEKRQSLKGAVSAQKYEEIGEKIEEIKRKGLDLPVDFDESKVREVIEEMVGLQFDEFSPGFVEESTKEIKKVAFLQRLEHIKIAFGEGKEVKEVLKAAEKYWGSIEKYYDDIEAREVREKLDEVGLEVTLGGMKQAKKVDMSLVSGKQNGLLIRARLQSLAEFPEVSDEDKLLIQAWLGESVDIKTGKIDEKAMERLVRTPKLWGVLAGVKEEKQEPIKVSGNEQEPGEESAERKREITEVCQRYGVDEDKLREVLEKGEDVYIVKGLGGYKAFAGRHLRLKIHGKNVVSIVYNNAKTKISYALPDCFRKVYYYVAYAEDKSTLPKKLESLVFPDGLEQINSWAFEQCKELRNVRFPRTLESIGDHAFVNSGLETVSLPDSLVYLGNSAFYKSQLHSVEFGAKLKEIGALALGRCLLENVEIPKNIVEIGSGAFCGNPLKNVTLHEGLKIIGREAFEETQLRKIVVPSSVTQYSNITEPQRDVEIVKAKAPEVHPEEITQKDEKLPSLEELKKQKAELEEMLAKINSQLKTREQENDLEK